jgi:hypothetical protein
LIARPVDYTHEDGLATAPNQVNYAFFPAVSLRRIGRPLIARGRSGAGRWRPTDWASRSRIERFLSNNFPLSTAAWQALCPIVSSLELLAVPAVADFD